MNRGIPCKINFDYSLSARRRTSAHTNDTGTTDHCSADVNAPHETSGENFSDTHDRASARTTIACLTQ